MHNAEQPASASRRDRFLIVAAILLVTALAWVYLIRLGRQMPSGMEYDKMMAAMGMASNTPWKAADAWFTLTMWMVMMAGMMAPAAAPMLLLFAGAHRNRSGRGIGVPVIAFSLGYFLVWIGFSGGATLAQWTLHGAAMLSGAMGSSNAYLSAAILVAAGAYQMTPWKGKCLAHCRSPLGFLMTSWRSGTLGALRMGLHHGAYCLGCCWAVMSVLFAVGVMNLAWVAGLAVLVLLEKTGPYGVIAGRIAGAALVVMGIVVLV